MQLCTACGEPLSVVVQTCPACERVVADYGRPFYSVADSPEYDFDGVTASERADAADVLVQAEVPYRWDTGFRIRVAADREEEVDELFGHGATEADVFATLVDAAGRISLDPSDEAAIAELGDATGVVITSDVPFDMSPVKWATIAFLARQLVNVLETSSEMEDIVVAADLLCTVAGDG